MEGSSMIGKSISHYKKQVIYDGGHGVFPRPYAVRDCLDGLDKYLGPVRH